MCERRRSSRDSSKAVSRGSRDDSAMSDGAVSARYALMRACEWRSESASLDATHSSHPHLPRATHARLARDKCQFYTTWQLRLYPV
ncbi:Protein of unknown function [Gryllus bimaculatus]|nr:Protein of unknown function [Gryllus bimaculatus]